MEKVVTVKRSRFKGLLILAFAVTVVFCISYFDLQQVLRQSLDWVSSLGPWGPVAFGLIYVLAAVLFIPGSLLTLGAGVVFGVFKGALIVLVSATLAATVAFLVGRYLAREWVGRKLEGYPRFRAIDEAVAKDGWKIVGLTRLSPVFPFNLLNYAFGITQVSLRDYFLASFIGMIPGTLMYVYIGSLAGDLAALGVEGRTRTPAEWVLYVVGLLATVAVTIVVTRLARKALDKKVH
jgi:uncharacterized membrane protein YdjX (TVP38/TMEM64 family)